jgi:hypothetical protein
MSLDLTNYADPVYAGESFADVKAACHRWLLRKDPTYRKACEKAAEHRDTLAKRKSDKAQRLATLFSIEA